MSFTPSRRARGYTLVETLMGMAVSGVLATISLPQFSGVMGSRAADASIQSLATALRLARAEAFKRGEDVTVCARDANVNEQVAACAPSGKDWSAGWLVFVDRGQRGALEDGDLLLQFHQPGRVSLQVASTVRYLTFQSTGISLNAASHFDFLPYGKADAAGAKRICVNKPGRLRRLSTVEECTS